MDTIDENLVFDEDLVFDSAIEQECQSIEPSEKRVKRATSEVWKFFTKLEGKKDRVKCNACNSEFAGGGKKQGTSTLKRHIQRCKEIKFEDVGQMMLDMQGKLKSLKIEQMVSREKCAKLIIRRDLPFKFCEFEELTDWLQYLNPEYIPITRNTAKADVLKVFMREKAKLKEEMADLPCRISLTSDLWTSCNTEGYISLTAHFVDKNWKLNSKILNFRHMHPPHSGFELSNKAIEFLHDWGIEKKIFSITLDNASANDVMQQTMRSRLKLQNWLLCDGEFFHVRCCAHILNLIVQEGLKIATDALHKIRDSIKYVRGSESRMIKFKQCIEKVGNIDASSGLVVDVPTRWNSTYLMLKSALKYQRVFENLHCYDANYVCNPSKEEWSRAQKMSRFLLPFYEITTLMSGTSYPTSNLYFLQVWKIQCLLLDSKKDEDEVIKSMAENMLLKFEKYWDEYSVVLAFGTVLDPRIKLDSLGFCYEKLDPYTWEFKVEQIKEKLYKLFSQYSTKSATSNASNTIHASSSKSSEPSLFDELKARQHQVATKTGKSQLDIYLDESVLDLDFTDQMDVLQWWKNNRHRFPELSIMARDLLSIPITTVASESSFSIGSRVLNKYRNRLLSENVEALLCSRNWMHAFNDDGNDDDNDDENGDPTFSKSASNVLDVEDDA